VGFESDWPCAEPILFRRDDHGPGNH
jgi:hypothetical protein